MAESESRRLVAPEVARRAFVLVLTFVALFGFLMLVQGFLEALLLGSIFSGMAYPLYRRMLGLTGDRPSAAALLTLLFVVVAVLLPAVLLLGIVADQALQVAETAQPWIESQMGEDAGDGQTVVSLDGPLAKVREFLGPYADSVFEKVGSLIGNAGVYLAGSLGRLTEGAFTFFLSMFVMLYAMFFFLQGGQPLIHRVFSYIPLPVADKEKLIEVGLSVSRATIRGTLIIGVLQGSLCGLGFWAVGVDAPVFWGALMMVLSVLPGIGTSLVWGPAVVILLFAGQVPQGVGLLVWCGVIVGNLDNVLRPALVGHDTELPDLLVLLGTLGGLGLFGPSGLVIGPMLAALFLTVLSIYSRVFADWLSPGAADVVGASSPPEDDASDPLGNPPGTEAPEGAAAASGTTLSGDSE